MSNEEKNMLITIDSNKEEDKDNKSITINNSNEEISVETESWLTMKQLAEEIYLNPVFNTTYDSAYQKTRRIVESLEDDPEFKDDIKKGKIDSSKKSVKLLNLKVQTKIKKDFLSKTQPNYESKDKKELKAVKKEYEKLLKDNDDLTKKYEDLLSLIKNKDKIIEDNKKLLEDKSKIEQDLNNLKNIHETQQKVIQEKVKEIDNLKSENTELENKKEELTEANSIIRNVCEQYVKISRIKEEIAQKYKELLETSWWKRAKRKEIEVEIEKMEEELNELKEELKRNEGAQNS